VAVEARGQVDGLGAGEADLLGVGAAQRLAGGGVHQGHLRHLIGLDVLLHQGAEALALPIAVEERGDR